MKALWIALVCACAVAAVPQDPPAPAVSIWYRGTPAGTPKLDDLVGLAAAGFTRVTWPAAHIAAVPALTRLALDAGVTVDVASAVRPLTASTSAPIRRVDVIVRQLDQQILPALVWRAIARGAREIAFDAGAPTGTGLTGPKGETPPWLWTAIAVSRVMKGNATLLNQLRAASAKPAIISGGTRALDVTLLDSPHAWVAVATNAGPAPIRAMVRLPKGVPYAMWVSVIDGEPTAMFDESLGPRWDLRLGPGAARVIVIDHARGGPSAIADRGIEPWQSMGDRQIVRRVY